MDHSLGPINSHLISLKPILKNLTYLLPLKYDVHLYLTLTKTPQIPRLIFSGTVREATREDLPALVQCNPKKERFLQRFQRHDRCLIAEIEPGKVVGYEWFSEPPRHYEQKYHYTISIPENTFYLYDAYILPEYRVSGVWLAIKAKLGEIMAQENKEKLLTYVSYNNTLSLRTHIRFGFQLVSRVSVLTIANFGLTHKKPLQHSPEVIKQLLFQSPSSS